MTRYIITYRDSTGEHRWPILAHDHHEAYQRFEASLIPEEDDDVRLVSIEPPQDGPSYADKRMLRDYINHAIEGLSPSLRHFTANKEQYICWAITKQLFRMAGITDEILDYVEHQEPQP